MPQLQDSCAPRRLWSNNTNAHIDAINTTAAVSRKLITAGSPLTWR
jgi:hypothetical protein